MFVRSGSLTRSLMFDLSIIRTPAVLRLDNKSKNCIVSGFARSGHVRAFSTPPQGTFSREGRQKYRPGSDPASACGKLSHNPRAPSPNSPPIRGRFKERLSESGCKCRSVGYIRKHPVKNIFLPFPQGVVDATGNTLPLNSLWPSRAKRAMNSPMVAGVIVDR